MNDTPRPRARFIAGARCPACGATDTIKAYPATGAAPGRAWCVECDHVVQGDGGASATPVRIVDPARDSGA